MDRGLTGLTGMFAFLEEWALVTEELYDRVMFPKIKIRNPYQDWTLAMQQMRSFLGLQRVADAGHEAAPKNQRPTEA